MAEEQAAEDVSVPESESTGIAPATSFGGPKAMRLNSSVEMMPSVGMPEPSPTTGLVTGRSSTVEVISIQVSSPSSKDRVDYSGSNPNCTM